MWVVVGFGIGAAIAEPFAGLFVFIIGGLFVFTQLHHLMTTYPLWWLGVPTGVFVLWALRADKRKEGTRHKLYLAWATPAMMLYLRWAFISEATFWLSIPVSIGLALATWSWFMTMRDRDWAEEDRQHSISYGFEKPLRYRPPFVSEDPTYDCTQDEQLQPFIDGFNSNLFSSAYIQLDRISRAARSEITKTQETLDRWIDAKVHSWAYESLCRWHNGEDERWTDMYAGRKLYLGRPLVFIPPVYRVPECPWPADESAESFLARTGPWHAPD